MTANFHYMILLVVWVCYWWYRLHSIFFIPSLDNDLPEWISNWKPVWSELKFLDPNCSISSFIVFRKSLAVFCNSTESSIVLLVTNFVTIRFFLETIRWDFLNFDTQPWDVLNIEFKFPISSWAYIKLIFINRYHELWILIQQLQ